MRIVPVCRRPTWRGQGLGLGLAAAAARRGEGPALPARRSRRGPGPGPEAERRGAERGRAADSARPGGCPRSAPRGCPAASRSAPPAAARGPLSGASPPRLRALRSGRPGEPGAVCAARRRGSPRAGAKPSRAIPAPGDFHGNAAYRGRVAPAGQSSPSPAASQVSLSPPALLTYSESRE